MRIISGLYKGRRIKHKLPESIRPTQDAIKETIFNILNNYLDLDGIKVLDLCAGSGSLGLESISRGADKCVFVDKNYSSMKYIKQVCEDFDINKDFYKLKKSDANTYTLKTTEKFDLVFFDPPYHSDLYIKISNSLKKNSLLNSEGLILVEMPSFGTFDINDDFYELDERISGETKLKLMKYQKID